MDIKPCWNSLLALETSLRVFGTCNTNRRIVNDSWQHHNTRKLNNWPSAVEHPTNITLCRGILDTSSAYTQTLMICHYITLAHHSISDWFYWTQPKTLRTSEAAPTSNDGQVICQSLDIKGNEISHHRNLLELLQCV